MTTLGASLAIERMIAGSCWQLCVPVNGFAGPLTQEILTQASAGRSFQLLDDFPKDFYGKTDGLRFQVRLLEDGYKCWLEVSTVIGSAFKRGPWTPQLLNQTQIKKRIPKVLHWLEQAANRDNQYLWGGTIGPDFDCSGLVQTAFASQSIWLPRDAYQQEKFCEVLQISIANYQMLRPGDLLFFGTMQKCTHVGIYIGEGTYCHSSGIDFGRNGIGFDGLKPIETNSVASYYLSQLRCAGRVVRCHDGMTLP